MENNNVENQVNEIYDNIKTEVAKQVQEELLNKGATVIPNDYDPGKDIIGIVNQYNKMKDQIKQEMEYNEKTYRDDVLKMKNYNLKLDLEDEQRDAIKAIDYVYEKATKVYEDKIARMQNSPEYKEAKNESFQLLSLLKDCEIPVNKLMEIASPLIEAHDVKSLEVCQILLTKNATANYAMKTVIDEIKTAKKNPELLQMMDVMTQYIRDGKDNLPYFIYMNQYGGDK